MITRSMDQLRVKRNLLVSIAFVSFFFVGSGAVVTSGASDKVSVDGPPGLIEIKNVEDLVAEASIDTQKREIPSGGLSNSYGEPIPADSYGPPLEDNIHVLTPQPIPISDSYGPPLKQDIGLPIPVYGVPDDISNNIKYPEPPPDIPPPLPVGGQPHQTYGPPLVHDVYGPPKVNLGPGHPIKLPGLIQYHGPPPPPPKLQYGPPKAIYGPPKQIYGPPKIQYGPPKPLYGPPKPQYIPPKIQYVPPKPLYGPPKPLYGPPKVQYGPPKIQYGPPKVQYIPPKPSKPVFLQKPHPIYGAPIAPVENTQVLTPLFPIPEDTYGPPGKPINGGDHFSQQLLTPDQAYGPPIGIHHGPPQPDPDPKPAHPGIPAPPTPPHILYDGWTPIPGLVSKPPHGHIGIGLQDNYGPPPPPPPSLGSDISTSFHSSGGIDSSLSSGISSGSIGLHSVSYGVPLPSGNIHSIGGGSGLGHSSGSFISSGYSSVSGNEGLQGIDLNSIIGSSHSESGIQGSKTVFEAHYTEGANHGNIDSLSHVLSGNTFDKPSISSGDVSVLQSLGFNLGSQSASNSHSVNSISTTYGAPLDSFSVSGPYPGPRQLSDSHSITSDIGLKPPSGIYGVPPGGKYGIPPPPPPHNSFKVPQLALSYGVPSGSTGTGSIHAIGGSSPKRPINFRDPVPQGLIEHLGQSVVHKDNLGIDESISHSHSNTYLSPPVQQLPDKIHSSFSNEISHDSGSSYSIQASIEPTNLYSLPSVANPVNFHSHNSQDLSNSVFSSSSNSFNSHVSSLSDSYGAPSIETSITTTLDGKNAVNIDNSESDTVQSETASLAAAILKNCPYHKALYEAAKNVEQQNPSALASTLIASLNSENTDSLDSETSVSTAYKQLPPGTNLINFNNINSQSSQTSSVTSSKEEIQKGKSLNEIQSQGKTNSDGNFPQFQSLTLNANQLEQNEINHQQILSQNFDILSGIHQIPVQGSLGSYTLQIQSADGQPAGSDSVPHEQVLSEGLLQSILQAIEQPHQTQLVPQESPIVQLPSNEFFDLTQAQSGLVLPEGYEVKPKNVFEPNKKDKQEHIKRGDQNVEDDDDDDEEENETEKKPVIIVAPQNSKLNSNSFLEQFGTKYGLKTDERPPEIVTPLSIIDDNEIAVYFNSNNYDNDDSEKKDDGENKDLDDEDATEMVTEISVETSISASDNEPQKNAQQYEQPKDEIKSKFGDKIIKKIETKSEEKL